MAPGAANTSAVPQADRLDVFISYSRRDGPFVRALAAGLEARGKDVWADWDDVEPSAVWWQRIERGIVAATAFAVVISPDQLASETCARELAEAVAGNKRIVPVLHRPPDGIPVPPPIADLNWIFARDQEDLERALDGIVEALDTDLEWRDRHARLLVRAREWEAAERNTSFLLHGRDLDA